MAESFHELNSQSKIQKNKPIHIIGGGGVGMSALAQLLIKSGFQISASDKNAGKYLEKLGNAGAKVWVGSKPDQIPANAMVFYSSAINEKDPERVWAKDHNLEIHSRHTLLKTISQQYHTISISGTHGKTTTTGWIAYLLEQAGFDPNALVGGTMVQWNSNVRLGHGKINEKEILVIEADESDESFLFIESSEVIVTNIELDHVDRYNNLTHVVDNFYKFIENCQHSGGVFFPSFEVQDLVKKFINTAQHGLKVLKIMEQIQIDVTAHGLHWNNDTSKEFFKVGLAGRHNLWNAFAVLAFAVYHNLSVESIRGALLNFKGVERRMQYLGEFKNDHQAVISVIDDYAHHPTEIKMVIETLQKKYDSIIAIWEPHRISRWIHFNLDFQSVFKAGPGYQNLFLMNVFDAAGESQMPEFSQFSSILKDWSDNVLGTIAAKGNYISLLDHINSKKVNTAVVFLGAGNSAEYAADFYKAASKS
ncbi:MAG: Mur ligase family protein [Spirochaetia bacterium]|nr:Mur ligase family protein [Spirochaetia bacterium]